MSKIRPLNKIQPALLVLFFAMLFHSAYAQDRFDIALGMSTPDVLHLEGRWYYNKNLNRVDFKVGTDFGIYSEANTLVLIANHAFYFGKTHDKIGRKTWTFNTAPVFIYSNNEKKIEMKYWLNVYFAKEIILSQRLLLEPELGIAFDLHTDIKRKKDYPLDGCVKILPFYPKFGLNLIFN